MIQALGKFLRFCTVPWNVASKVMKIVRVALTVVLLLGGSCLIGYGLAQFRARQREHYYEQKALFLMTETGPKGVIAEEIANFLDREKNDSIGAIGWLLYGTQSVGQPSFEEMDRRASFLVPRAADKAPRETVQDIQCLLKDDFSLGRVNALARYCDEADGPALGLGALGWYYYGCLKGDPVSYEVVDRWIDVQTGVAHE